MAERKKNRADKEKDEIEFEKNKDVYTFQPNAHKYKGRRGGSPSPQKKTEALQEVRSKK